jgi:RimJ/RimL family protein N-acetyltransferase
MVRRMSLVPGVGPPAKPGANGYRHRSSWPTVSLSAACDGAERPIPADGTPSRGVGHDRSKQTARYQTPLRGREQSRYRRFFTVMPELPEATLKAATEVDHANHEALVARPLLSTEIVGECRFVRRADQPDTADMGVTVVDAWQGRGLGSALLALLSERALDTGIDYFAAEVLAENRTMLALLPELGRVETDSLGPVVTARVEITEPPGQTGPDLLDLLTAAAAGDIVSIPVLLRRLIQVPDKLVHIVRFPVTAVLDTLRLRSSGP